jgi:hypothetical protein
MSGMTIRTPLALLSESELQSLVQNQVAESETLDYKREMYGQGDADRRELLRDVSSLANRLGGHLLIGIREEGEIPVEVEGIENGDIAAERIMSSCFSGIHERINGFDVRPIQLANGRSVLAVYVPPSTRVPHMVTLQQEDRFWIRHGRQKMRMSVAEIREACLKVENLSERAETFINIRRERFIADKTRDIQPAERAHLRIAVTPLEVTADRFDIGREDIRGLMRNPPNTRQDGWVLAWVREGNPRPTMIGLQIGSADWRLFDAYRNGGVELYVPIDIDGSHFRSIRLPNGSRVRVLHNLALVEYTVCVYRFYKSFAEMIGITDPLILTWDLVRAHGWGLRRYFEERDSNDYYAPRIWQEEHLILPPMQVPNLSEPDQMAKAVLDRVWQSFGYESTIFFDEDKCFNPSI